MDLMEMDDMGSGCEGKNCALPLGFPQDCSDHECQPMEEPMFGLIELVCVTAIYIPLMLFGLLGNILTILVVWLRPHMRSSTYLYLSSMAVSDLLILLLLPLDLYKLWRPRPWPLGDLACKLTMFLSECCTFCTILHITFLSLERYLAVCWPITAKTLVTRRRTRVLIVCLWLGAAVSAAPVLVMVGVEEVEGEELGISGWREDVGWTGREGELEGIGNWEETQTKGWSERPEELIWFEEKGERKLGTRLIDERKQRDGGEMEDEKQSDGNGSKEEGKMGNDRRQQNKMKEDEGGGREEGADGGHREKPDRRECRCTHYAASSGLLSVMMILSNMYFLIPFCILGLVYSLIGRTLCLRPQSSRKDQSHRHTVKMLGVIVLAFVLCWLPFHVGRTIFSLSLGTGIDRQETYMDTNSHLHIYTPSDSTERDTNLNNVATFISHSDMHFNTGQISTQAHKERDKIFCDIHPNTHSDGDTPLADLKTETREHADDMTTDRHFYSHVILHRRGKHRNAEMRTHNLSNDPADVNIQLRTIASSRDTNRQSSTNSTTQNKQNSTSIFIHTQSDILSNTPPAAVINTHAVTPSDLYYDDTHLNNTYVHSDTHMYFLYYLSQYFNLVSSVLFYLSAAINPLLYNLMSTRYRHAVHSLIHTYSPTQSQQLRMTLTARHSTTTI